MSAAQLASLVDRLEKVTQRLETINLSKVAAASGSAAAPSADSGSAVSSPALDDYDALVAEYLAPFLASSETIGKEVKQAVRINGISSFFDNRYCLSISIEMPKIRHIRILFVGVTILPTTTSATQKPTPK
eukprot:GEZU01029693.1.p1 GENE.GEZU01029693.1~~GEZU01029693.1.p1  ORF type:complete len:131 (-),score=38.53 GEZU01029693.1:24-416(-)